jgi:AraC-like DNA-binding protein
MFSFLAGISLSEYIRRRRLTLAALDLKDRDLRIIDVAVKYGYNWGLSRISDKTGNKKFLTSL